MSSVEKVNQSSNSCCGPSSSGNSAKGMSSSGSGGLSGLGYFLRDRRVMFGIAAIVLVAGAFFNWGWLVAIGVAPLILAFAPCAAMCALGLCAMGKGSSNSAPQPRADEGPASGIDVTRREADSRPF